MTSHRCVADYAARKVWRFCLGVATLFDNSMPRNGLRTADCAYVIATQFRGTSVALDIPVPHDAGRSGSRMDTYTVAQSTRAFVAGCEDGLALDLSGYADTEEALAETDWATPTINALGPDEFARHIGISPDAWGTAEWQAAVDEYNRGCSEGVAAQ